MGERSGQSQLECSELTGAEVFRTGVEGKERWGRWEERQERTALIQKHFCAAGGGWSGLGKEMPVRLSASVTWEMISEVEVVWGSTGGLSSVTS